MAVTLKIREDDPDRARVGQNINPGDERPHPVLDPYRGTEAHRIYITY